jgi:hypothetical protein
VRLFILDAWPVANVKMCKHGTFPALRITPVSGTISASSRTYTRRSDGGSYGQYIAAGYVADYSRFERKRILQLSHSADPAAGFRTNIGLVDFTFQPISVLLEVRSADNKLLRESQVTLETNEHRQLDRFLEGISDESLDDITLEFVSWSVDASYLVYASVVDNVTGDAMFIPVD